MDYEMTIFFRQKWYDDRFDDETNSTSSFSLDSNILDKIWTPDRVFTLKNINAYSFL